ncbi:MAG TPA: hypothetical protein VG756_33015 [Pseudonocardiaceae bacterium]|jgi:uncharacterized protein YukE|nr:hypothetical protein [Pseudonocardiaceae bacterium]
MTAAPTTPNSAPGDATTGNLSQLAAAASPLDALSAAGFGEVQQLVSFLDEPLRQLAGDPGAVSSAAGAARNTGTSLSSIAESYRTALTRQTGAWTGTAADTYRSAGTQYATGITALSQAATTLNSAISGAGEAVAQTAQGVRQDIADAVGQMLPLLTQARAQESGTGVAQVIPQCVKLAEAYGRRIAARMRALLASGQNLKALVEKTVQDAETTCEQAFQQTGNQQATGPSPTSPGPSSQSTTQPSSTSSTTGGPNTSNQSSADQSASTQPSADQDASSALADDGTDPSTADSTDSTDSASGTDASTDNGTSPDTSPDTNSGTATDPSAATLPAQSPVEGALPGLSSSSAGAGGSGTGSSAGLTLGAPGSGGVRADAEDGSASKRGTASAASGASDSTGSRMFGSPMGGGAGKREEDKERHTPDWLRGNRGLFDPDGPVTPAVIDAPPDTEVDSRPRRRWPSAPASVAAPPDIAPPPATSAAQPAEPAEMLAEAEKKDEALPAESAVPAVKVVWRMSESGELQAITEPESPQKQ